MDFILIRGFEIFLHMKNEEIYKCIFKDFHKGIKKIWIIQIFYLMLVYLLLKLILIMVLKIIYPLYY